MNTDSSQKESGRGCKRRREDRSTNDRARDDVSSPGPPSDSDSGEMVDSLQIGRCERKGGRPATLSYRHKEDGDDETKGG
jgi:hypothetical protein